MAKKVKKIDWSEIPAECNRLVLFASGEVIGHKDIALSSDFEMSYVVFRGHFNAPEGWETTTYNRPKPAEPSHSIAGLKYLVVNGSRGDFNLNDTPF